jgi:hypothetical protein
MATTAIEQTKLDYFMDVLLRNYCRTMEENEILYEEMTDLKNEMGILFRENADMRHMLKELGVEAPVSDFVSTEDLAEIETLGQI